VKRVIECGDEILMIKNSYGGWGKWMFPGGGVGKNEAPESVAEREIMEEVGVKGNNFQKIGEYISSKEYKRDTVSVFKCSANTRVIKIDPGEISEAKWFKLNNLPEVSNYSKDILNMLKSSKKSHG